MKASRVHGFTLIELVVVITILGILAAFAIPRFITLDATARTATVNGLAGTVRGAAALARGMAMAASTAATGPVTMEGNSVTLSNYYPDSGNTGILLAVNVSPDFSFTPGATVTTNPGVWTRNGAPTPANCAVSYTPAAAGAAPAITTTTTGC